MEVSNKKTKKKIGEMDERKNPSKSIKYRSDKKKLFFICFIEQYRSNKYRIT